MHPYRKRQLEKEALMSATRLRELLEYDAETGVFTNRPGFQGRLKGAAVGRNSGDGYVQILIDQMYFFAHRLAWLYVTGRWPVDQIDHIDLNKKNNRFVNLREAHHGQNQGNRPANKNNQSGVKGVRWNKPVRKWQARITSGGKDRHLGYFLTIEDAATAYAKAAQDKFGIFARTGT